MMNKNNNKNQQEAKRKHKISDNIDKINYNNNFDNSNNNNRVSLVALYGYTYLILLITILLIIDYDSSKLVNCQLEAVGAVLSVVPVTSILATAGLVGVKLAALSRLLQVLGYDQAYLASGGSGTAAQPIGLQTNYAYMFPYVPGLNISVKGEHGSQYHNPALGQKDLGYSTTRKTFPAMALPGDYESQSSPFRGAETLREIFRDSGINFRFPAQQQQPHQMFNTPKGNGQSHTNNNNHNHKNLDQMNNNVQQILATTPFALPQPAQHQPPPHSMNNEQPINHMNNQPHLSQPHNAIPTSFATDSNGHDHNQNGIAKPVNVIADFDNNDNINNNNNDNNNQQAAHNQASTLNSQQGQHAQSQPQQSHPVSLSQHKHQEQHNQHQPSPQLESPSRHKNNQVNMPHPSNIRPNFIYHNNNNNHMSTASSSTSSSVASGLISPLATTTPLSTTNMSIVATLSHLTPPPPSSRPSPALVAKVDRQETRAKANSNEPPELMNNNHQQTVEHGPSSIIPQHAYYQNRFKQEQQQRQQQKLALPTGKLVTVPSVPSSRPPSSFDDYVRTYFGAGQSSSPPPTPPSPPPPPPPHSFGPKKAMQPHLSMGPLSTITEGAFSAAGTASAPLPSGPITTLTTPNSSSGTSSNSNIGPSRSDMTLTTNIIPSSFVTDVPPPFHDDMENNEINLGNRRRRKRALNVDQLKKQAAAFAGPSSHQPNQQPTESGGPGAAQPPPPISLSDMLMPRGPSSVPSTNNDNNNKAAAFASPLPQSSAPLASDELLELERQQRQPDRRQELNNNSGQQTGKHENFGMPALNIYPSFRKRRSLKEKIIHLLKDKHQQV